MPAYSERGSRVQSNTLKFLINTLGHTVKKRIKITRERERGEKND
jgi:hypothetical protein